MFTYNTYLTLYSRIRNLVCLYVLVACTGSSLAASAVVNSLDITAGEKGIALTIAADAPFSLLAQEKSGAPKDGMNAFVSIKCSQAIYGLNEFTFKDFPASCPIKRISVNESPASGSTELLLGMTISPENPILVKQKGNKWIILISKKPVESFVWNAAEKQQQPLPSTSQQQAQKVSALAHETGMSLLTDVSVLTRDKVEQLVFSLDRTTEMKLKRDADKIVILFVNASNNLSQTKLSPPSARVSNIEFKQMTHGGSMWLGTTITLKKGVSSVGTILQAFPDHLVLYTYLDTIQRYSAWSAKSGKKQNYNFVKMPLYSVDYKSIEKKVKTDLAANVNTAKTFAIKDVPAKQPESQPSVLDKATPQAAFSGKKQPEPVRLFITKNNVNVRAGASASDPIVVKLPFGESVLQLDKKGTWVKIKTSDTIGWIANTMIVDSAKAPKEILDKINSEHKKQLEKKIADDKKAQLLKEQQTTALLAKKKMLDTQLDSRGKAASHARDSVIQSAIVSDSLEKSKQKPEAKLVEYHVYGRDPFIALSHTEDSPVPNVEDLNLVGILYDDADRIGLLEDRSDKSKAFAFRENDPVQNGYVLRIQPDKILFLINELGISRTYALKLIKNKE